MEYGVLNADLFPCGTPTGVVRRRVELAKGAIRQGFAAHVLCGDEDGASQVGGADVDATPSCCYYGLLARMQC